MRLIWRSVSVVGFLAAAIFGGCRTSDKSRLNETGASPTSAQAADETPLPPYDPVELTLPVNPERLGQLEKIDAAAPTKVGDSSLALTDSGARYFFAVYGFQGVGPFNLPRFTHTWAIFLQVDGTNLASSEMSGFTLSWDAADGHVGLLQGVEPGRLYTLTETKEVAARLNIQVDIRRSPFYETNKILFEKARARYFQISDGVENGNVKYAMVDDMQGRKRLKQGQPGAYSNCIHAITDILTTANGQLLETGLLRGFAASDKVVQWFFGSPYVLPNEANANSILSTRLGI